MLVEADGLPVAVGGARVRALLVRLALDVGQVVTLDAIGAAVWPDGGPAQPANAVQTLVSRLRRALPDATVVRSVASGYRLELAPETVDAVRFERLAAQGRRALAGGDPGTAARQLREALGLWRGEALAEIADTPYAAAAATRLTELRVAATEDRIAADLATGPPEHVVAELRQLATSYPLRERVRVLLVRALHAAGRPAEALAEYERFRRTLGDELGADPGPELREAHLRVLRGEAAAPAPAAGSRGNLRVELTSFVGRDEQRRQLAAGLMGEQRLVTLVGPGGAGKTRLAATVAADLAPAVAGGAWLVELAPVTDPGEVAAVVIATLGVRDAPGETPGAAGGRPRDQLDRLVEALAGTEALLVLDNCEHVLDAVARLADGLLGRCPRLRILTTSREPLGIGGESLVTVPPLELPAADAGAAEAGSYPAVRLFVDRASAARPGFAVSEETVAQVVEICRRLDGLPLAIELAAARLRSMTLPQVAARLDDRFRLLGTGSRVAVPRHQTLRAVVAWSWELLSDGERRAARRLAVFPGAIMPAAAEQVCETTVDTLASLVDKSLLQLRDGGEPSYRMLETIREYGWEELVASGERDQVRAAHARYYLALAERAAPHLRGAGQLTWMARLQEDRGSPVVAGFAHETGDADTLVRLAAALGPFWTAMGDHGTVARRLRRALIVPGDAPAAARASATATCLFNALLAGGDPSEAVRLCREDRRWSGEQPFASMIESMLALVEGDTAAGLAASQPQLSVPDPWARGMLWLLRSWLHGNDGAVAALRAAQEAAVAAFRQAGERWGLATALTHLAHQQVTAGEFDEAVAGLSEAVRLLRELDPDDPAVQPRVLLAAARAQRGDRVRARAELLELVEPGVRARSASSLVLARISLGDLARLDGDLVEAGRQYDVAEAGLAGVPYDTSLLRAMVLCARGHWAVAGGAVEEARRQLAEAFTRAVEIPDLPVAADVAVAVARLCWSAGSDPDLADGEGAFRDAAAAARLLGAAHALRGAPDAYDPDVAELAGGLRVAMGEQAYQAAYARGRELPRAEAAALVRAQVSRWWDRAQL